MFAFLSSVPLENDKPQRHLGSLKEASCLPRLWELEQSLNCIAVCLSLLWVLVQKQKFQCSIQWLLEVCNAMDCIKLVVMLKAIGHSYSFLIWRDFCFWKTRFLWNMSTNSATLSGRLLQRSSLDLPFIFKWFACLVDTLLIILRGH